MILNDEEIATIKSMAVYWNEVAKREKASEYLHSELFRVITEFGTKVLWILEDYAFIEELRKKGEK